MSDKSKQKRVQESYQPKPRKDQADDGKKGYQPKPSQRPEGQNPPSGGSNVNPPPQNPKPATQPTSTSDTKKDQG